MKLRYIGLPIKNQILQENRGNIQVCMWVTYTKYFVTYFQSGFGII